MSISRKLLQTQSGVAPEVVSWTLTKAITERQYSVGDGGGLYVGDIDTTPSGMQFKPDGTKLFVVCFGNSEIFLEFNLSTPFELYTASLLREVDLNTITGDDLSNIRSLRFNSDGTKLYLFTRDYINEYTLSTAWDITSETFVQSLLIESLSGITSTEFSGFHFKPDGTTVYVVSSGTDLVYQIALATAWDISTASFTQSRSVSAQETAPQDIFWNPDGTKMYILGDTGNDTTVYTFPEANAWDIGAGATLNTFSANPVFRDNSPRGMTFSPDGTKYYISGQIRNGIYSFSLSTPYLLESGTVTSDIPTIDYLSVQPQETAPRALSFKPDGLKMYVIGSNGDDVNEYDLSTAWAVSTASWVQSFSVNAQEVTPEGLFFKPDGLKMYVTGASTDTVYEYDLSTAWDVSTSSFLQGFSVATQEGSPGGIFFKPDGLKMYIVGQVSDTVNEFDLSTAWDVSTASFLQNFSVVTEDTLPQDLFFKPDGTKMFVCGAQGQDVNEYDLSTAWDVTTASFLQNFNVKTFANNFYGMFFKPDGTKMFALGVTDRVVAAYNLS
jgi:DNA-binding beta-propeller fold protein YncE